MIPCADCASAVVLKNREAQDFSEAKLFQISKSSDGVHLLMLCKDCDTYWDFELSYGPGDIAGGIAVQRLTTELMENWPRYLLEPRPVKEWKATIDEHFDFLVEKGNLFLNVEINEDYLIKKATYLGKIAMFKIVSDQIGQDVILYPLKFVSGGYALAEVLATFGIAVSSPRTFSKLSFALKTNYKKIINLFAFSTPDQLNERFGKNLNSSPV